MQSQCDQCDHSCNRDQKSIHTGRESIAVSIFLTYKTAKFELLVNFYIYLDSDKFPGTFNEGCSVESDERSNMISQIE